MGWRCMSLGIWLSGDGMFCGWDGDAGIFVYDCLVMGGRCSSIGIMIVGGWDVLGLRYKSIRM